jgi:hypothetical protein
MVITELNADKFPQPRENLEEGPKSLLLLSFPAISQQFCVPSYPRAKPTFAQNPHKGTILKPVIKTNYQ